MKCKLAKQRRRGTATVEFALVAPILFMLIFGSVEFGRLSMAMHGMGEAAREGCRIAILKGNTPSDVQTAVANRMASFGISTYTVTIDPTTPQNACLGDLITVTVTATYKNISWLPTATFLENITLTESCALTSEADYCK